MRRYALYRVPVLVQIMFRLEKDFIAKYYRCYQEENPSQGEAVERRSRCLREGFLSSDDEVGCPSLEDDPGVGLNPQPASRFGQQPEEREAAVSGLHHCGVGDGGRVNGQH